MPPARSLVPVALAALLLATSCASPSTPPEVPDSSTGSSPSATAGADPDVDLDACAAPGGASEGVQVDGEFGGSVTLNSDLPVTADTLQRSVVIEGDGDKVAQGSEVTVSVTIFNGASGDVIEAYPAASMIVSPEALLEWAYRGVNCAVIGERAVVTVPAAEALGENLEGSGFAPEDTAVIVFDITGQPPGTLEPGDLLPRAEGEPEAAPAGFPDVAVADDGLPTITMPTDAPAPTELSIATLITGDGDVVSEGDRVYVHYRGVIWRTGEDFDSSWTGGQPVDFLTTEVIGGFSEALVGQTVGSQVISLVPADTAEGGYGAEQLQTMGYEADDVMVFVLDILGTVSAS